MNLEVLAPTDWADYALLDSGEGLRLERFGRYVLQRPDNVATWHRRLPESQWLQADAVFEPSESGQFGKWLQRRRVEEPWEMSYHGLRLWARLTAFRHTGVFPEQAVQWDWIQEQIRRANRPVRVLDLFGYTALASLAAAAAGAEVTYVDASTPALTWARQNQSLSGLDDRPIRWILDDSLKFVRREARRGNHYDAIVMDPPVFGRGPKGETWRFFTSFPALIEQCRQVLSDDPLFILINAYAINASALMLYNVLADLTAPFGGEISAGELALMEDGNRRYLPTGIFGRWRKQTT